MCRCVGWNSYPRVYTSEKLLQLQKQVHDCKHGLMGYNKRFLALTAGAPGSTHDARFLRSTEVFKDIIAGDAILDKVLNLGDEFGESPLLQLEIVHSHVLRGY